jgi:hypothetical protein
MGPHCSHPQQVLEILKAAACLDLKTSDFVLYCSIEPNNKRATVDLLWKSGEFPMKDEELPDAKETIYERV